jgi:poly(A) polymerase
VEPSILERSQHPISRRDIDANVLKVLYRLISADHLAYLVGGSVRDLMMERRPKDFDVATSAHPHEVRELFRNSRLIGRRFRLVHVFFGRQNIEVATFRRRSEELAEGDDPMIHHDNTFGTPEEDAFRRDFTVNTLFYDARTFNVIDYTGGVADLRARLIRTVGEPEIRMREDPIRMIRAVRFAAKLDFEIERATREAIERHCGDLAKASVPRLVEEIFRTLGQSGAAHALVLMEELGLLEVLLPILSKRPRTSGSAFGISATVRNLDALGRVITAGADPSHSFILACLFADLHLTAVAGERFDLAAELRARGFSRADTEHMRLLLEALPRLISPTRVTRRLARRPYFEHARRLFELLAPTYGADIEGLRHFLAAAEVSSSPAWRHRRPAGEDAGAPPPRRRRRSRRRRRGGPLLAGAPNGAPAGSGTASSPEPSHEDSRHGSGDGRPAHAR